MTKTCWEFTGETRIEFGVELKQIRAVCDFGFVVKGDLGGWISDKVKLAQNGRAWIGKLAKAFGGIIEGGTIEGGIIEGGIIEGGTIRGGIIEGGTIRGGIIEGGTIRDGTIEGGIIEGGIIEGGTIRGGAIRGGIIEGGIIEGGTIWDGTIEGGIIEGGTIRGGTIEGGTIEGGIIEGGIIQGGTIWGGTIRGGTIRGGTIRGGTIEGGIIEGGIIEGGTIWGGDFLTVSPIGSENGQFTAEITAEGQIICNRGCFSGTLEKFEAAVAKTHGTSPTAVEYGLVVQLVRARLEPIAAERRQKLEAAQ
jgi:hypothetical protein